MQFLQHAIALKIYSCVEKDIVKNRTDCFLFKLLTYFFMGVGPLSGVWVSDAATGPYEEGNFASEW